jgi:hypothetical protein
LREGAAAFVSSAARDVAKDGASDADRIDAGVPIEPLVLDRDDRVLQIGRDLRQLDVVPLLVESEPDLAVAVEKDRVADTARQTMDDDRGTPQPDAGGCSR